MSTEMNLRAKAARIAGQAEIKDVRTRSIHADMDFPPPVDSRLGYDMDADFEFAAPEEQGDLSIVQGQYKLALWLAPTEGEREPQQFATLSFALVGLFDIPLHEAKQYSDEEWQAFVKTSAQFALYPYARETVSMLTTRLGIPPLTMGVLRLELDREEVEALTAGE